MKAIQSLIFHCLLAFALLFSTGQLKAQVYPGDVDNNGVVDNLDVLYMGYAYGQTGPSRINLKTEFTIQFVPLLWSMNFPDGINFAFADADGSGQVDHLDLLTLYANYGQTQAITEDTEYYSGISGNHTSIRFDKNALPPAISQGSQFEIPILLGDENIPAENINGIAFSLEYNSELIKEISLEFDDNSWITEDGGAFAFQSPILNDGEKIDAALSRYGNYPLSGLGRIGKINIIVEDDLISLLPSGDSATVVVQLTNLKLKNGAFWDLPVVSDSLSMMIYHPDALVTNAYLPGKEELKIFPNPTRDLLNIFSPVEVRSIEIFDLSGKLLYKKEGIFQKQFELSNLSALPKGIHFLKVFMKGGIITKRIIIEP